MRKFNNILAKETAQIKNIPYLVFPSKNGNNIFTLTLEHGYH